MFSIDGIASGFDTSSIIETLLGFQQRQVDVFNTRKAEITTQQSAFKGIEAQLITLRSSLGKLNRSISSVFDVKSATSTDEEILGAAASSGASPGIYNLTVNSLAKAHQIGSQGFESTSATIASGEISFKVGDRPQSTITIDDSNNTLNGLVQAINDQVDDVNAGVIYDQGSESYRLLLTSKHTGAENEITVTNNLNSGTGVEPDFSGDPVQAASNAVVTLGSGAGAITAEYATNQVEGLIENVTLDLRSADPGKTVSITIDSDHEPAKEAIGDFVENFNSVMDFIEAQTAFNPETNVGSPLLGNRNVSRIQNELFENVVNTIGGLDGLNRLSTIGVDIDTRGRLTVDEVKLDKALNGQLEGVDPNEIKNLFGLNAESNRVGVEFLTGSNRTQASDTPYEVDITQAAERASITATSDLKSAVVVDDSNNEFQITVNGQVSEVLTLDNGTYTPEELADHLESVINASEDLGVNDVEVSVDETNRIVITSETYGARSTVSSVSGEGSSLLGFSGTENEVGKDVAGVFIVNGVREEATGSGRLLIGDSENENTADLQVRVTLTSDQLSLGSEAEIQVTRGVAGKLEQYLADVLDPAGGLLSSVDDEFDLRVDSIDQSISRVEELTESKRADLIEEFTRLETVISQLQTTGNFLSTQLANLPTISANNN